MQANKDALNAIAAQVRRLVGLPGWPKDEGAELIAALSTAAVSIQHATAVIDSVLESAERCSVPADLRRIAALSRDGFAARKLCGVCNGDGWISAGMRLVTTGGRGIESHEPITPAQEKALRGKLQVGTQGVYDYATRCTNCAVAPPIVEPRRRASRTERG